MPRDHRKDPKTHARFLSYKERHVYFGRGDLRQPLSYDEFGTLDDEREELAKTPKPERTPEATKRIAELEKLLLLD